MPFQINRSGRKVVEDFQRLLQTGDMAKLTPGLYYALTQHGGFIAHFDIHGFRATYQDKLSELIEGEMYPLDNTYRWRESMHHLKDSVYTDGMTAHDVMRDISTLADNGRPQIVERESNRDARYVIAGHVDSDDGTLYWSNDDGWGHLSTATVFSQHEQEILPLPLGWFTRWVMLPNV